MHLAIVLPTHESIPAGFTYDLARMTLHLGMSAPESWTVGLHMVSGTYVHSARQNLLRDLLQQEDRPDWILWLDTDMRFPIDLPLRLLDRGKSFIGINYAKRDVPTDYVGFKTVARKPGEFSRKLVTNAESTGVEEVEALGFGAFLMETAALRDLPSLDEGPWFFYEWMPGQRLVGEDVFFCNLIRDLGQKIWVDHDLSKECAHIGQFHYRLEMVDVTQAAVAAKRAEEQVEGG